LLLTRCRHRCAASGAPQPPLDAAMRSLAAVLAAADDLALAALAAETPAMQQQARD
jgi:hypothetical protein